jgi:hypothetical protein
LKGPRPGPLVDGGPETQATAGYGDVVVPGVWAGVTTNVPCILRGCAVHALEYIPEVRFPGLSFTVYLLVPTKLIPPVKIRRFCVIEPRAKLWNLE